LVKFLENTLKPSVIDALLQVLAANVGFQEFACAGNSFPHLFATNFGLFQVCKPRAEDVCTQEAIKGQEQVPHFLHRGLEDVKGVDVPLLRLRLLSETGELTCNAGHDFARSVQAFKRRLVHIQVSPYFVSRSIFVVLAF